MWIEHILLGAFGLMAGAAVSAGTFSFLIMLKIIPRMISSTRTAAEILLYENMIILGGMGGNILSTCLDIRLQTVDVIGYFLTGLYGLCAGIFVGSIAVALAEILQTFPILFRRLKLKEGLGILMISMALGKFTGALYFFLKQMTAG